LIKEDQEKELRKLRRKYIIVGSRYRLHADEKKRRGNGGGVVGIGHGGLKRL
jgi:hypothetical protein